MSYHDSTMALCLWLCFCRSLSHESKLRRKHKHKKNEHVHSSCAYAYALYVASVLTCLLRWPKSVMAISIILFTAISIYSRQFQFVHGNFNLLTAILILICSWQFQFTHGNFNFTHSNFNLLTAISIFSWQCSRHFSLCSPPVYYGGWQWPPKVKIKSRNLK